MKENLSIRILMEGNYRTLSFLLNLYFTYVFESVCELVQASFLNWTIENNENTEKVMDKLVW